MTYQISFLTNIRNLMINAAISLSLLSLFTSLPVALADDKDSTPEKYIASIQSLTDGDWVLLKAIVNEETGRTQYIFNAKMYSIDSQQNEIKDSYRLVPIRIDNLALFEAQIKHYGKPTPLDDNKADKNNLHKANLPLNFAAADGDRYFFHDQEIKRAIALEKLLGQQSYFIRNTGERTKFLFHFSEALAPNQIENFSFSTAHPSIIHDSIKQFGRFIVPHGFNNDTSHEILLFPDHELAIAKQLAASLGYDLSILPSYNGEVERFIFSDKKTNFKFAIKALQRNKGYNFEVLNIYNYVNAIGAKKFKKSYSTENNIEAFKKLQELIKQDKPSWKLFSQMTTAAESIPTLEFSNELKKPELNYGTYYSRKSSDGKIIKNPEWLLKKYFPAKFKLNSCHAFYF